MCNESIYNTFGTYKNSNIILNTYNDYAVEVNKHTIDVKEVQDAITKYTDCLNNLGYEIDTDTQMDSVALDTFGKYRKRGQGPSSAEQAMALDDYTCQEKADLLTTVQDAFKQTAGQWMVENEAMLLERYEDLQTALKKANQVINGEYNYQDYLNENKGE